eukprot:scaffold81652_cov31-Attheya_sp.AAC.1
MSVRTNYDDTIDDAMTLHDQPLRDNGAVMTRDHYFGFWGCWHETVSERRTVGQTISNLVGAKTQVVAQTCSVCRNVYR